MIVLVVFLGSVLAFLAGEAVRAMRDLSDDIDHLATYNERRAAGLTDAEIESL